METVDWSSDQIPSQPQHSHDWSYFSPDQFFPRWQVVAAVKRQLLRGRVLMQEFSSAHDMLIMCADSRGI